MRKTIEGLRGMNLGKIDLRNEAQRPRTIADVPFGLLRPLPSLYRILPARCLEEPVEPMPATEHDVARVRTGVTRFPDERRSRRPIDVWRHVGFAAEATRSKGSVRCLLDWARDQ